MKTARATDNPALYEGYRQANAYSELAIYLGITFRLVAGRFVYTPMVQGIQIAGHERNHLFSLGTRPDYLSNLIIMTTDEHKWFHANLPAGRVLSVLAKIRKRNATGEPSEFTLEEFHAASGKYLVGWLESLPIFRDLKRHGEPPMQYWHAEAIKAARELESEEEGVVLGLEELLRESER